MTEGDLEPHSKLIFKSDDEHEEFFTRGKVYLVKYVGSGFTEVVDDSKDEINTTSFSGGCLHQYFVYYDALTEEEKFAFDIGGIDMLDIEEDEDYDW